MHVGLLILITVLIVTLLVSWACRGLLARVIFALLSIGPGLCGPFGALHAWGEAKSLPGVLGWLTFSAVLFVLAILRLRRP